MATLFENNSTAYDAYVNNFYGVRLYAQSFTPQISHTITSIKINTRAAVGTPTTLTIAIRATSSSLPTGDDLTTGTADPSAWTAGEHEITLTPYKLTAGTEYAYVMSMPGGDNNNKLQVRDETGQTYTRGIASSQYDGGAWTGEGYSFDFVFKEYGAYGSGELSGLIAIVEERFHYVDAYGVERYIEGTVV